MLRVGQKYSPEHLAEVLRNAGYVESDSASEVWNGSFSQTAQGLQLRPNSADGPSVVDLTFNSAERISSLTRDGLDIDSITLAPESLTQGATKGSARIGRLPSTTSHRSWFMRSLRLKTADSSIITAWMFSELPRPAPQRRR
jgi:hypothetical protein